MFNLPSHPGALWLVGAGRWGAKSEAMPLLLLCHEGKIPTQQNILEMQF
jgi:hypothetical protein